MSVLVESVLAPCASHSCWVYQQSLVGNWLAAVGAEAVGAFPKALEGRIDSLEIPHEVGHAAHYDGMRGTLDGVVTFGRGLSVAAKVEGEVFPLLRQFSPEGV